ncbi:hypothetical protein [uncultured Erythrobacter sp.]|uniref:hypothetical protein n=1 Tax=uncultured Erythrobacter sp. TaxID=263913 RepID=UPI00261373BF|nr:hypothetical protein [uncultured Erythrobacter sp.]
MRELEWGELTARLSAARDLRQVLQADMGAENGTKHLGFTDAAAQFFRANSEDERCVNPNALEARKASSGMKDKPNREADIDGSFAENDSADGVASERCEPGDAREEQ